MIKKLIIFVSALMLIGNLTALADEKPTIALSDAAARPGETVEVDLLLQDNPGIASMILTLTYDENALKLVSVEDKGILGTTIHGNNLNSNPYKLCWANDTVKENYTSNGVAVTLSFEVSDAADGGVYPVTVSYNNLQYDIFDVDLNPVDFEVSNGSITVSDAPAISISDFKAEDTVSFCVKPLGSLEGTIICAVYGESLMSVQTYPASASIDVSVDAKGVSSIKIMWWNPDNLAPCCECEELEL